jgi:hypothetical protein
MVFPSDIFIVDSKGPKRRSEECEREPKQFQIVELKASSVGEDSHKHQRIGLTGLYNFSCPQKVHVRGYS